MRDRHTIGAIGQSGDSVDTELTAMIDSDLNAKLSALLDEAIQKGL
jgi:hypothetical protein